MSPSAKKGPRNSVAFKMQDEELQGKTQQPVRKLIERNRLKMVLRNLSLLRLLKSPNPRIQELHSLAKWCWNLPLRVQKLLISSRNSTVCCKADQNNEEPQEARCSKKKLQSEKLESAGKPRAWEAAVQARVRQSRAAMPEAEQQVEPKVPKAARGHGQATSPGAWGRQQPTGDPGVVVPKTHHGDMKQPEGADQWVCCEGLPTRVHLPGPRVMCRSSTLRWVKRCCTRFCSASLELPMCHPYRV